MVERCCKSDETKRYLTAVAAHNLGRILWKLFGVGEPRALQGEGGFAALAYLLTAIVAQLWIGSWHHDGRPAAALIPVAA